MRDAPLKNANFYVPMAIKIKYLTKLSTYDKMEEIKYRSFL